MDRYLVEIDHPAEKGACLKAVRQILEMGSHFVTHAEWGCLDDVHTGWIIVEAESHDEARLVLPPVDRSAARVVKLARFDLRQLDEIEAHHPG
ncbi:MAG TPA: hypothetical protein VI942_05485 [Thermoanaerobaculia bacterium]|nr:hypothetical protein [Thermoanaerobaculia bacterium]